MAGGGVPGAAGAGAGTDAAVDAHSDVAALAETGGSAPPPGTGRRLRRADILGISWVVVAAVLSLLPALIHGSGIYEDINSADLVDSTEPWIHLAWRQVHNGHLPLWNPYSALGAPLSFNWHADPFSLQSVVGYLLPQHWAFPAQLFTTLFIAGIGIYVLCATLGIRPLGCTFAATTYALGGIFFGWLGLTVAGNMAWAGWVFAAGILVLRGRRPTRDIAAFAVVLGLTIYSSQPETLLQLGLALGLFLAVLLVILARRSGVRSTLRPLGRLALGTGAGLLLGAPLIIPSLPVLSASMTGHVPNVARGTQPIGTLFYLSNITGKAYLGIIGVAMAVLAVRFRGRRPEAIGLVVVSVAFGAAAFLVPVVWVLNHMTGREAVHWSRAVLPLGLGMSVLGGMGIEVLVTDRRRESVLRWAGATFAIAGVAVLIVLLVTGHLPESDAVVKYKTFAWRAVEVALGLGVTAALFFAYRRQAGAPSLESESGVRPRARVARRFTLAALAGVVLLAGETAFLVVADTPQWANSATSTMPWGPTPAITSVQQRVGANLVAFGTNTDCFPGSLGILQDVNVEYQVHELAVYDPATPYHYLQAWTALTGENAYLPWGIYCPAVTSAAVARLYGVRYVLEPKGARAPAGMVPAGMAGYSDLYFVPGSARVTTTPLTRSGGLPSEEAPGTPASLNENDSTWTVITHNQSPAVLRLRLTDVPGWHATIDGKPLALERFAGVMLQARIPAGRHVISLSYWPSSFSFGLALAGLTVLALILVPVVIGARRSRRARPPPAAGA